MAHLMPHSILTAARATCQTGSSQPDQIGFSKLLNVFFLLLNPTKSELKKGSEHSILAQNLTHAVQINQITQTCKHGTTGKANH